MTDRTHDYYHGPVWLAFGLTRAAYAVFPRRALQSMPAEWQQRFVDLVNEMHADLDGDAIDANWSVNLRDNGRFAQDWRAEYRHTGPVELKTSPPAAGEGE